METVVSVMTQVIIIFTLYFSVFWILVLFNSYYYEPKKRIRYPSVTIIVAAYNEEKGIEKTVKSCLALNYPGQLEVIVVNDASKDKTINILRKYKDRIKIIDKKKNEGKSRALNDGVKVAKGELVGVVDADSTLAKSSLKNAVKHFYNEDSDKVGAVISKMRPSNTSKTLERLQELEYVMAGMIRYLTASLRLLHLTPGVLSLYRRDLVKEVGNFDPNVLTEDFEIAVRIRKMGYLVLFAHDSEVNTEIPDKLKPFLNQRIRWTRGYIQTHRKHKEVFFNKKFGFYGLYKFPMDIVGPLLFFSAVFTISYHVYKQIYEFLFKLIFTPGVISWFSFDSLSDFVLTFDPQIELLILVSIILSLSMIYGVLKFYRYPYFRQNTFKKLWYLFLYIMIYNYIYLVAWVISITKELRSERHVWGTK